MRPHQSNMFIHKSCCSLVFFCWQRSPLHLPRCSVPWGLAFFTQRGLYTSSIARALAKSVCAASGSHCFEGSTDLFWGKVLSLVEELKKLRFVSLIQLTHRT